MFMSLLDNWFPKKAPPAESAKRVQTAHAEPSKNAVRRKQQRMERRELLYVVVREAMAHAGVLSASYSFKVLSLEPQGRQYLIMVDLARDVVHENKQQADIEKQVVRNAKARHDIVVSAIYWRFNERLKGSARNAAVRASSPPVASHRFEPIGEDEVAALRQALAVGMTSAPPTGFEDTEVIVSKDPYPVLSRTQYGDLN